MVTKF